MSDFPWSKFFWSDWESDQGLRLCSLSAQGLWMRMLCICAKSDPRGYLAINGKPLDSTGIARLCNVSAEQAEGLMEELFSNGVFSRDRRGWIYSRRMVRDMKKSATGKKFANKRWSQTIEKQEENNIPNGSPNGQPITQKPEARILDIKEKNTKKENPDGFEAFWKAYPRKVGKGQARKAYEKAIEKKQPGEIILAATRFDGHCTGKDPTYIPHPATWLNGERWEDEISKIRTDKNSLDNQWISRLDGFFKKGFWSSNWGPEPGKTGCRVPESLLGEFQLMGVDK